MARRLLVIFTDWVFIGTSALQSAPNQVMLAKTSISSFQSLVSMTDQDLVALGITNTSVRQTILAAVEGWKHDHRFPGYHIHFGEPDQYVMNPALAVEDSLEDMVVEPDHTARAANENLAADDANSLTPPGEQGDAEETRIGTEPTLEVAVPVPPKRGARSGSASPDPRGVRHTMIRTDPSETVIATDVADQTLAIPLMASRDGPPNLIFAQAPHATSNNTPSPNLAAPSANGSGDAGSERTQTREVEAFVADEDANTSQNVPAVPSLPPHFEANGQPVPTLPALPVLDTCVTKQGGSSEPHSATTVNVLADGLNAVFVADPEASSSLPSLPSEPPRPEKTVNVTSPPAPSSSSSDETGDSADEGERHGDSDDAQETGKSGTRADDASQTRTSARSSARPSSTTTRGTSVVGENERPMLRSRGSTRSMASNSTGDGTAYQRSDEGESSAHIKTEPQTPSGESTPPPNSPSKGLSLLTKHKAQAFDHDTHKDGKANGQGEMSMYDQVLLNKLKHMFPNVDTEVFEIVVKYEKLNVLLDSAALNGGGHAAGARAQGRAQDTQVEDVQSRNAEQGSTTSSTDTTTASSNQSQSQPRSAASHSPPKQHKTWGKLLNSSANVSCASISYDNWRTVEERVIRKIRQIDG